MGKDRGVFQRPPASGIWWVNYYVGKRQHREKAGSKTAALKLYKKRKQEILEGRKLPELRARKVVTLSDLIDDALEYASHLKDYRNVKSRGEIIRSALGTRPASEITPQELLKWLNKQTSSPATFNRYKALLGRCYTLGRKNRKVTENPARDVDFRIEDNGRIRFLTPDDEYPRLHAVIEKRFPEHLAEFVVSCHTGMRLSEQYTVEGNQVHLDRKAIELLDTKNGSARTVHLNADAIAAIESLGTLHPSKPIFPRNSEQYFDNRSWFASCLEEAGIQNYSWHCNRHSFGSWLAMTGASPKVIQEAGGWKTIQMAMRYSHLSPEHRLSAVDKIATLKSAPEHAPA